MTDFKDNPTTNSSHSGQDNIQYIENIDKKITLSFALLIFLLMFFVLLLAGLYFTQAGKKEEINLGETLSQSLLIAVQKTSFSGKYQTRLLLQEVVTQQDRLVHLIIQKKDGQIYAHSDPSYNNSINLDLSSQKALSILTDTQDSAKPLNGLVHDYIKTTIPIREYVLPYRAGYGNQLIGVFRVGISQKEHQDQIKNGWVYLFSVIFCLFLLSIVCVYFLSQHLSKPIRLLAAQLLGILHHAPLMIAIFNQKNEVLLSSEAFKHAVKSSHQKYLDTSHQINQSNQLINKFLKHSGNEKSHPQISHYEKNIDLNNTKLTYYITQFAIAGGKNLSSQHCFIGLDISQRKQLERHLEQLVLERTKELESANRELTLNSDKIEKDKQQIEQSYMRLQQMQKQLLVAEKMSALGGLVAGVAHEINTPLGLGLTGMTFIQDQLIKLQESYQTGKMTETQFKEFLIDSNQMINSAVGSMQRAAKLIKSFKQIAVSQSYDEKQIFNLFDYFQSTILSLHSITKKNAISINSEIEKSLNINSFPGFFSQILTNLILNSVNHAFEKMDQGIIKISAKIENQQLLLKYSDNGCGLNEEQLRRIYEPFFTTKRGTGGSGLGMQVVYNIVTQKLNGEIDCHSTLNQGVHFTMTIPLDE